MASPATGDMPNGIATPNGTVPSQQSGSTPPHSSTAPLAPSPTATAAPNGSTAPLAQPSTSLADTGTTKRPRDARLLHMVLAHLGVSAYQERVPLQLMDFAYRYTAGVLSDAVAISAETTSAPAAARGGGGGGSTSGGRGATTTRTGGLGGSGGDDNTVSLASIRAAIAGRLNYQFNPVLPKEFLLELAQEKNRVSLPRPEHEYGVRLPPERYCFTGAGWSLKEEWESDVEDDNDDQGVPVGEEAAEGVQTQGIDEDEDEDDEFEDVMGGGREHLDTLDG